MARISNNRRGTWASITATFGALLLTFCQTSLAAPSATGNNDYPGLIELTEDFFAWKSEGNDPLDRSANQAASRLDELKSMQAQLSGIAVADWGKAKQVDYLAVRSAMDQHDFMLQVSKPWERDPGFYVDRLQRLTLITRVRCNN
jgi:hypothetical protein